jgi:hypothetical protein
MLFEIRIVGDFEYNFIHYPVANFGTKKRGNFMNKKVIALSIGMISTLAMSSALALGTAKPVFKGRDVYKERAGKEGKDLVVKGTSTPKEIEEAKNRTLAQNLEVLRSNMRSSAKVDMRELEAAVGVKLTSEVDGQTRQVDVQSLARKIGKYGQSVQADANSPADVRSARESVVGNLLGLISVFSKVNDVEPGKTAQDVSKDLGLLDKLMSEAINTADKGSVAEINSYNGVLSEMLKVRESKPDASAVEVFNTAMEAKFGKEKALEKKKELEKCRG